MKIVPNPVYKFLEIFKLTSGLFLVVLSLMMISGAVKAADQNEFQKERAACLNGQSGEDRATCLKELGAARGEAKRGNLTDMPSAYQNNALARCSVLPPADRDDCARRVRGDGTISGSVKDGGVLRETRTIVTEPQPPASGMQGQ